MIRDEVDWRSNVEVFVDGVEVGDEVGIRGESESLICGREKTSRQNKRRVAGKERKGERELTQTEVDPLNTHGSGEEESGESNDNGALDFLLEQERSVGPTNEP